MRYFEEKEVLRGIKDIGNDSYEQVVIKKCEYCGINNIVIKQIWNERTGYEMHSFPSKREYLAGKKVEGLGLVCDSCASISGRMSKVKELESSIKHYKNTLEELHQTVKTLYKQLEAEK